MKHLTLSIVFITIVVFNAQSFWAGVAMWLGLCFGWYWAEGIALQVWGIIRCDTDMDKQVRAARRYRGQA